MAWTLTDRAFADYANALLSDRAEVDHVALVRGPVVFEAEKIAA